MQLGVGCKGEEHETYFRADNLSTGGVYLRGHQALREGSMAWLTFCLPGDNKPILCGGQIRHVVRASLPGMNVSFFRLGEEDRARIDSFIETQLEPEELVLDGR